MILKLSKRVKKYNPPVDGGYYINELLKMLRQTPIICTNRREGEGYRHDNSGSTRTFMR
jgi:hypothetical protein